MMSLYQEMPKESIFVMLRRTYTPEELDSVRLELNELLHSCNTLDQLHGKLYQALRSKQASELYRQTDHGNLLGI